MYCIPASCVFLILSLPLMQRRWSQHDRVGRMWRHDGMKYFLLILCPDWCSPDASRPGLDLGDWRRQKETRHTCTYTMITVDIELYRCKQLCQHHASCVIKVYGVMGHPESVVKIRATCTCMTKVHVLTSSFILYKLIDYIEVNISQ